VEGLRAALASADKDKASLGQAKARLATAEKQVSVDHCCVDVYCWCPAWRPARPQCRTRQQQIVHQLTLRSCTTCRTGRLFEIATNNLPALKQFTAVLPPCAGCSALDQIKNLEWEAEVLTQRFAAVQAERDALYDKFLRRGAEDRSAIK